MSSDSRSPEEIFADIERRRGRVANLLQLEVPAPANDVARTAALAQHARVAAEDARYGARTADAVRSSARTSTLAASSAAQAGMAEGAARAAAVQRAGHDAANDLLKELNDLERMFGALEESPAPSASRAAQSVSHDAARTSAAFAQAARPASGAVPGAREPTSGGYTYEQIYGSDAQGRPVRTVRPLTTAPLISSSDPDFPRSHTMRLAIRHPAIAAAAAIPAAVLLARYMPWRDIGRVAARNVRHVDMNQVMSVASLVSGIAKKL